MKRKVLVGFVTLVLALAMTVTPAFAAPVVVYDNAGTVTWGQNGGVVGDLYVKLEEAADFDLTQLDSIATIEITLDTDTYFKPQYCINTESNNWEGKEVEHAEGGHFVDVLDVTGKYSTVNTYNNIVIQSGWKNEGNATVTAIAFKDADGNVLYSVGDLDVAEEEVVEEEVVEEEVEEVVEEEVVEEVPQTGIVSLALVYGLGALATGAVVLKKRNK